MPQPAFVPPQPPEAIRYQDHLGSPSRSEKTIQRILSQSTRVHILRDKIDAASAKELELRLQNLGAQVTSTPDAANVVVTVLKAPKRIAKHFSDEDVNVFPFSSSGDGKEEETRGNGKEGEVDRILGEGTGRDSRRFIVTPDWIKVVEKQGTLVDPDLFPAVPLQANSNAGHVEEPQPSTSEDAPHPSTKRSPSSSSSYPFPTSPSPSTPKPDPALGYYSPLQPPPSCPRWQNTRFACRRPSPLFSPNQPLIAELELIRTERKLTGDTYSEMAYMRAISALKAYPFRIPDPLLDPPQIFDQELLELRLGEVEKLKGVGKKVFSLIKQYYSLTTTTFFGEVGRGRGEQEG